MLENKSSLYSLIQQIKCGNLDSRNKLEVNLVFIRFILLLLYLVIYFASYKRVYPKTGKWVLSRKRDNVSNSGYVRKWKTRHCLENGQEI